MTFEQLELCRAIQKAGRCADTPKTEQQRRELAQRVQNAYLQLTGDACFPFYIDDIVYWDTVLRKSKDTRIKVSIANTHGTRCFWANRGKGQCCNEVEAGHLIAKCNGGPLTVSNGMIECRRHNNERRELTIEEYLFSSLSHRH